MPESSTRPRRVPTDIPRTPPPAHANDYVRSFRNHSRIRVIFALALFPLVADVVVLYVASRKPKIDKQKIERALSFLPEWFGFSFSGSSITQIVSTLSTIFRAITVYLGGLAITQLWAREVFLQTSSKRGGTLAELQSLGIFQSPRVIVATFLHLIKGRFLSRRIPWILSLISAVCIGLYPTALITLGTPTLEYSTDSRDIYEYSTLPFMTNPGYGDRRCKVTDPDGACLGNLIAGSTTTDIGSFNSTPQVNPPNVNPLWVDLSTVYSTSPPTEVWMNIGPLNNANMSSGAILMAQNFGALERFVAHSGDLSSCETTLDLDILDADVNTTTPLLISQCTAIQQTVKELTSITIHNTTYLLPTPIASIDDRSAIGQITPDNMTLIISFKPDRMMSSIHCAIHLGLRPGGRMGIGGDWNALWSTPNETPWDWGDGLERTAKSSLQPIGDFAAAWLRGMGWNGIAVRNSVSEILASSQLSVGTDSESNNIVDNRFAEYYTLAMLSGAINIAFSPECLDPTAPEGTEVTGSYSGTTAQYRLGLASNSFIFWFWVSMILFNFIFICVCVCVIFVLGGWLPDWTEPTTLLCTTLLDLDGNCLKKACPDLMKTQDVQENPPHPDIPPKDAWSFHMFTTNAPNGVLAFGWTPKYFSTTPSGSHNESEDGPQMQNAVALAPSYHRYSGISGSRSEPLRQAAVDPEPGSPRQSFEFSHGIPLHEFDNSPKVCVSPTDSSQQSLGRE